MRSFSRYRPGAVKKPTLKECQDSEKFLWEENKTGSFDISGWDPTLKERIKSF